MPRLTQREVQTLTPETFQQKYVAMNRPVVFPQTTLREAHILWLPDSLEKFTHSTIKVKVSENPYPKTFGSEIGFMPMADFCLQVMRQNEHGADRQDLEGVQGNGKGKGKRSDDNVQGDQDLDLEGGADSSNNDHSSRHRTGKQVDPDGGVVPGIELDRRYVFAPLSVLRMLSNAITTLFVLMF